MQYFKNRDLTSMERVPFSPTTDRANQPEKCLKYVCTFNIKIKINKSQGSDSGNDLRARGKKNEEISRLKNQERERGK